MWSLVSVIVLVKHISTFRKEKQQKFSDESVLLLMHCVHRGGGDESWNGLNVFFCCFKCQAEVWRVEYCITYTMYHVYLEEFKGAMVHTWPSIFINIQYYIYLNAFNFSRQINDNICDGFKLNRNLITELSLNELSVLAKGCVTNSWGLKGKNICVFVCLCPSQSYLPSSYFPKADFFKQTSFGGEGEDFFLLKLSFLRFSLRSRHHGWKWKEGNRDKT